MLALLDKLRKFNVESKLETVVDAMSRNPQNNLPDLPKPILVDRPALFAQMMEHLQGQSVIAIDTESNSLFRYYPKVCLIQLTTFAAPRVTDPATADPAAVVDYLIDPLALADIQPLGKVLTDPMVDVIMHAAENDILILQRDFSFRFHNIFDTQLAARILGWKQVGLAAMLRDHFGVHSNKRMQRTDWGRRPLTAEQIVYAQMDTHFLLVLRMQMIEALQAAGRWEEAKEAFAMLRQVNYHEREQPTRTFWQMKNTRDVDKEDLAILQALWEWREEEARQRDRPPFKIATDQTLIKLANQQPQQPQELDEIGGLGQQQLRRYGKTLLKIIDESQGYPMPQPPNNDRQEFIDKPVQQRFDSLRQWRTKVAKARDVAPEIVFSNSILLTIAQQMPGSTAELQEIPEIGPWKAQTYGDDLLQLLRKFR